METKHTVKVEVDAKKAAEDIASTLATAKVPARVIALNALQFVGIFAAALVVPSPETAAVLAMLPDPVAGNIGKIALALIAAKPGLNVLGDLLDNGKLDRSWPQITPLWLLCGLLALCGGLVGCGTALPTLRPPDADGCVLVQRTAQNGQVWALGPCAGQAGKVVAYRYEWFNTDGIKIRATYTLETKHTRVEYNSGGVWVGWSSKSGIVLDGMPEGVQSGATLTSS